MSYATDRPDTDRPRSDAIAVVGLGYVGLPLAVAFDSVGQEVVGYDVDEEKVATLQDGTDPTGDVGDDAVAAGAVTYTTDAAALGGADYVIITVPTPVGEDGTPNLDFVEAAGETVGEHVTPGTTVVLESTVYPGATREILAPAVAETSGLTPGEEFHVGYSPERLAPGTDRGLQDVVKVVGGDQPDVAEDLAGLYGLVVNEGVHRAPDLETAEACKVVENVQRDVNIALMNELSMAFDELGLDTEAVLDAARTKWNFHGGYRPGLVGGHCIPVDPNFLAFRSEQAGYTPSLIREARETNDGMPEHAARLALEALADRDAPLSECRVLVLGLAYKPNVGDIRTSIVGDTIEELESFGVSVVGHDPHADDDAVRDQFGVPVRSEVDLSGFDGVVLAAAHDEYGAVTADRVADGLPDDGVVLDLDRHFDRDAVSETGLEYRTL